MKRLLSVLTILGLLSCLAAAFGETAPAETAWTKTAARLWTTGGFSAMMFPNFSA